MTIIKFRDVSHNYVYEMFVYKSLKIVKNFNYKKIMNRFLVSLKHYVRT